MASMSTFRPVTIYKPFLTRIPDPHHEIQMDRAHWGFMLVVFFTFCFSSMDSIEIWLFCV